MHHAQLEYSRPSPQREIAHLSGRIAHLVAKRVLPKQRLTSRRPAHLHALQVCCCPWAMCRSIWFRRPGRCVCRRESVIAGTLSTGSGALTGSWPISARRTLGRQLVELPPEIEITPISQIAFCLSDMHQLSTLGAEAVASSEHCAGPLCVRAGDDGPRIGPAMSRLDGDYRTQPTLKGTPGSTYGSDPCATRHRSLSRAAHHRGARAL